MSELQSGEAMAELTVAPGHAGAVAVTVSLMDAAMDPLAAEGLTVGFANPGKGIERIERQASRAPDGSWRIDALTLPTGGTWQVSLGILVSDFKQLDLDGNLELRP